MSKEVFIPEKVREFASQFTALSFDVERVIAAWLEQNPIEPVVVGLSDKQVVELHQALSMAPPERTPKAVIKDYYSSQAIQMTYQKMYNELHDCFVDLQKELEQLKSQAVPNWDSAPEWANWLAQDECGTWSWFDTKPNWIGDRWNTFMRKSKFASGSINWQQTLQERPKPTPQVEVGQTWRHDSEGEGGDDYEVTEVTTLEGKFKIGDEWQEDVVMITYENAAQDVYRRILSDFLAKFEQVQS